LGNVIRQSPGTYLASAAATSALIFQETFGGAYFFPVVIALSLILTGITMSQFAPRFLGSEEVPESDEEPAEETAGTAPKIAVGALGALASFMFLSWVVDPIQFSSGSVAVTTFFSTVQLPLLTTSDYVGAFVFTALLIPVAEEQFFRAFWGNLIVRFLPPGVAELVAGSVFMTFHFAVYSIFAPFNPNLALLLTLSGAVFVAVDLYTGDLFTSMLAHILNNSLSFLVSGSIIGFLLPGAVVPFGVSAVVPAAYVGFRLYRGRPLRLRAPSVRCSL
jgi:membrane protease YdiL (CAAX protease family)